MRASTLKESGEVKSFLPSILTSYGCSAICGDWHRLWESNSM